MKRKIVLFSTFLLTACLGIFAQSSEELIRKIKSGEIKVTPEMVEQGKKIAGQSESPVPISTIHKVKAESSKVTVTTPVEQPVIYKDTISSEKGVAELEQEYEKLTKASLKDLKLNQFGLDAFKTFLEFKDMPAPPLDEYIIGMGDEIIVYTWGRESANRSVFIDKDGYFNYTPLEPIRLAGMSFKQARSLLKSSIENISGIQAKVTLGQLRSIRIMVLGDVEKPGSYLVNAGTMLIDALFICGGIREIGSLRKIALKRGGETRCVIDLYNFLIRGDSRGNQQLVSGDVIFVPVIQKKAAVAGYVKRPAIYEAIKGDKISDLIEYAGGVSALALANHIVVERIKDNKKRMVLNVDFNTRDNKITGDIQVEDGDLIKVFPILSLEENSIFVLGNVLVPGKYQYQKGVTVKTLFPDISNYKPETFFDYAVVKRITPPDFHYEYIPFSLGKIYNQDYDFKLESRDTLFIFNRWELVNKDFVAVEGNVRKPGKILYAPNMHVSDAVIAAGGFAEDTYMDELHVLKYSPDFKLTSLVRINMNDVLAQYQSKENVVLCPNDKIVVFSKWNFAFRDSVSIMGEIKVPGKYKLVKGMMVSDLIKQAGGFTEGTYKLYIEVVRSTTISDSLQQEQVIKLDLKNENQDSVAFILENRDAVYIRKLIDYDRHVSISLIGLFNFPGVYRAEKGEVLSSLIKRAGGFRETAYLPGIVFSRKRVKERQMEELKRAAEKIQNQLEGMLLQSMTGTTEQDKAYQEMLIKQRMDMLAKLKSSEPLGRVNIKIKNIESFSGSEWDISIEDGDQIAVSENLNTVSILGEVYMPVSVVYSRSTNTVGECLKMAGGVNKTGDEDNIYLLMADGTIVTPLTCGFFTRFYGIKIEPGTTIVVPPKLPSGPGIMADIERITNVIYNLAVTFGMVYNVAYR